METMNTQLLWIALWWALQLSTMDEGYVHKTPSLCADLMTVNGYWGGSVIFFNGVTPGGLGGKKVFREKLRWVSESNRSERITCKKENH